MLKTLNADFNNEVGTKSSSDDFPDNEASMTSSSGVTWAIIVESGAGMCWVRYQRIWRSAVTYDGDAYSNVEEPFPEERRHYIAEGPVLRH